MAGRLQDVIQRDDRASQPAATAVPPGTLYYVTDEGVIERSTGSAWESYSPTTGVTSTSTITDNRIVRGDGGARGIQQSGLTIDDSDNVTGIVTVTIPNEGLHLLDTNASHDLVVKPGSDLTADRILTVTTGDAARSITLPIQGTIGIVIDGGGSAVTTGVKGYIRAHRAGTIVSATLLADQSGSVVIDVWKDTLANYPPTDADTITASAPPTISSDTDSEDTTLTGWTTSFSEGDVFGFNVDSATTITRVTLALKVQYT